MRYWSNIASIAPISVPASIGSDANKNGSVSGAVGESGTLAQAANRAFIFFSALASI
jgi:hypothetical protein